MIKLQKGGVVREVATQHEADYYEKLGYFAESSDTAENDPESSADEETPEGTAGDTLDGAEEKPKDPSEDDDKKTGSSGKKGTAKEG